MTKIPKTEGERCSKGFVILNEESIAKLSYNDQPQLCLLGFTYNWLAIA